MSLEGNMDIQRADPQSIHVLNDDCLRSIFMIFNASIQPETCFYNEICYEDILLQMQVVRSCTRFRDIFVHSFWRSMEKHLTLRPHQLYRTLGPLNYIYYIKFMRCQLKKLEIHEHYLQWFLDMMHTEGIDSFPTVESCILTNICLKPINEQDIRKIILEFLPNLQSLSLCTKIKYEDFKQLISLKEFRLSNHFPMDFSYFKNICNSLENVRILDLSSPLSSNEAHDDDCPAIEALPNNIEILHLNISIGKAVLPAIISLKKLQKLVLTVLNTQRARENLDEVNMFLIKKVECLRGFGVNESLENILLVWNIPNKIAQSLKVKKFVYSSSECIPSIIKLKRFVNFQNLRELCLRCCFGLKNETIQQIVKIGTRLQHLDITRCYSIDVGKLMPELLRIREKHCDSNDMKPNEPLWIYNVEDDMENQLKSFWKSQILLKNGVRCPIDLHSTGFVFDFEKKEQDDFVFQSK